jgi:hypothetical protein
MKQCVAVVLIIVLAAPPASAGQNQPKPIDWQKLQTGANVVLTITGGQSVTERVLFVNESVLVTRKAAPPRLSGGVENSLLEVGSYWTAVFNDGATAKSGRLRVSLGGVFDGDKKVADLTDVVRCTPRAEVLTISEGRHSHGARNVGIVLAALVGFIVVMAIAFRGMT